MSNSLPVTNDFLIQIDPLNVEDSKELSEVQKLYNFSFPDYESKPFSMILNGLQSGKMEAYSIFLKSRNNYFLKEFVGLVFIVVGKKMNLLDYLAIKPEYREHHIGSTILSWLSKKMPFFVEIESTKSFNPLLKQESSVEDKLRRKKFYLENGMKECKQEIMLFGVPMELLASISNVGFDEYLKLMKDYFGLENAHWATENISLLSSEKD